MNQFKINNCRKGKGTSYFFENNILAKNVNLFILSNIKIIQIVCMIVVTHPKICFYLQIDIITWNQRKKNVRSPEYIPDCVSRSLCWSFCLFSSSCSSHTCLFWAALFDLSAFCILNNMCLKIKTARSKPTLCVLYKTC